MLLTGYKYNRRYLCCHKLDVTRTAASPFAPSWDLLRDYKTDRIDWAGYEVRYRQEMRTLYASHPEKFDALVDRALTEDVILVCYEQVPQDGTGEDDIRCHRRLLADMLRKCAAKRGLVI